MNTTAKKIENTVLSLPPFSELNYERSYSIDSLILMFFAFSGIGWIWEVILHIIEDGMIINRGVMTGPWLPIYGMGGVLILVVLKKFRARPMQLFGTIMCLCGVIEYVTSILLESLFGARWWDYSDMLLSIDGRVCLEGLMIFGIGGLFFIYIIAPKMDDLLMRFSSKSKIIVCVFLLAVFLGDLVHMFIAPNMGFGITS